MLLCFLANYAFHFLLGTRCTALAEYIFPGGVVTLEEITGAMLLVPRGPLGMDRCLITSMVVMGCSGPGAPSYLCVGIPDLRRQIQDR